MKILNYLEAHKIIEQVATSSKLTLDDKTRSRIVVLSGRLDIWITPLTKLLGKNKKTTNHQALSHLKSLHLLEPVFDEIPAKEHIYLLPNSKAPSNSWLAKNNFIEKQSLFSPLFANWLQHQSIRETHLLVHSPLTESESKLLATLYDHEKIIVSRDDLAQALWGENWYNSYSDWTIDTNIHHLRHKLLPHWNLITIRNRGYMLKNTMSHSTKAIDLKDSAPTDSKPGILPTSDYLNYMNNPYNPRKVYSDLFSSLEKEKLALTDILKSSNPDILSINSYSFDNVDALFGEFPNSTAYFTGFDERALAIHTTRISEIGAKTYQTLYDDIRETRLQPNTFDLVINDFRLNWNLDYKQDTVAMKNMHKLLKDGGTLLLSVVVDARYESEKYGDDQEKAPLNLHKPWHFIAQEGLERNCHTVPYYKKLIKDTGFKLINEFDIKEGKAWSLGDVMTDPLTRPSYRRFLLKK